MEQLGINYKLLLAQLINFVLLFYIFKKFLAKPFSEFVKKQKQREKIQEEYEQKLAELDLEKEKILNATRKKAKETADQLIHEAVKSAEELKKRLTEEVKKEVQLEKEKLMKELETEKESFEKELKQNILNLSLKLTEETLKEFMTEERKKEYQKLLIKNLDKTVN
ncbi:MAG: hypothetical protein KatS3mg090_0788 [Patescibacteria group bacterium]|nr:MAG: hypothetical protein KatS3mg090_0788 [Patescibacteria group bacterium]